MADEPKRSEACGVAIGDVDLSRTELSGREERQLFHYAVFWTVLLFAASVVASVIYSDFGVLLSDLLRILLSPAILSTDYFALGSLAATFLNAALCGLVCNLFALLTRAKTGSLYLAGYFLVVSHCFFGLNVLNMWAPFLGTIFYALITKKRVGDYLPLAMFSTSLGPFVSEFLFRYFQRDAFDVEHPTVTVAGVLLALGFGVLVGFLLPAILRGTTEMSRGFSLYKAGLAVGIFGVFAHAFFYRTLGIETPAMIVRVNSHYETMGHSYTLFANAFFALAFLFSIFWGFWQNNRSFKGYKKLFDCDGWHDDFPLKFGIPRTVMNIGIYGIFILLYYNLVILLTEGADFTGPTTGVILAAISFSASGQTPKNVWPIAVGYMLLVGSASGICLLAGWSIPITLSTQVYLSGMAFATGLCPFTGRYGRRFGVLAGFVSALLCSSTAAMHGGLVLYNGGFAAGLTALLLVPILEFFHVRQREPKIGK